jgi:acyl carrier protein
MDRPEIIATLQSVFDGIFLEPVKLTPELCAADVEEWDSLLHISLMLAVEATFGIRFRMGEVEATKNIGEFAELIGRRLAEG